MLYVDYLAEKILDNDNVNLILSNNSAFDLVELLEMRGIRFNEVEPFTFKEVEELFKADVLLVSKIRIEGKDEFWFETAYGDRGLKEIGFEGDVVFIEEGLLEDYEINEKVRGEIELIIQDIELDLDLNNIVDEALEELDSLDCCIGNVIENAVNKAYDLGCINTILEELI